MNNLTNQGTYYSMVYGDPCSDSEQIFFKPSFKFCDPERFSPKFNSCCGVPPTDGMEELIIIYDGGGVEGYN